MLGYVELVSVVLGLLINLVASQPASRAQLAAQELPPHEQQRERAAKPARSSSRKGKAASAASQEAGGGGSTTLQLLCALFSTATTEVTAAEAEARAHAADGGGSRPSSPAAALPPPAAGDPPGSLPSPLPGCELTEASMHAAEGAGAASILQVYAAMLLGFLVAGQPGVQRAAAALLPEGGLASVLAAIHRCLTFYVTAGAIADASRDTLLALLRELASGQVE